MPEVIHVFSEQDSKGRLLAEVHRLQSSLAAMRQARDFHGANSADLMRERDRLRGIISDAEHLCKWLLQSDISDDDRERVTRENGINFAAALQADLRQMTAPAPRPPLDVPGR